MKNIGGSDSKLDRLNFTSCGIIFVRSLESFLRLWNSFHHFIHDFPDVDRMNIQYMATFLNLGKFFGPRGPNWGHFHDVLCFLRWGPCGDTISRVLSNYREMWIPEETGYPPLCPCLTWPLANHLLPTRLLASSPVQGLERTHNETRWWSPVVDGPSCSTLDSLRTSWWTEGRWTPWANRLPSLSLFTIIASSNTSSTCPHSRAPASGSGTYFYVNRSSSRSLSLSLSLFIH